MDKLSFSIKAIFFILLLGIFIQMFGMKSWTKFQKEGITIEYSTEFHEIGLQFPALTFCPFKGKAKSAWRNGTATINEPFDILARECNKSSSTELLECIASKTFNAYDFIQGIDITSEYDRNGTQTWMGTNQFTGGPFGVCFTFLYPYPIGTNPYNDRVSFELVLGFGVNLFIHDPMFFGISTNPGTFPHTKIVIEEDEPLSIFYIEATKHNKLNRPSHPCGENFSSCFHRFIEKHKKCEIYRGESNKTLCTTTEDIEEVDALFITIAMMTRRELVNISGCPQPCSYTEYNTRGDPIPTGSGHGIIMTFNTKEMVVLSQVN